MRAAAFEAAAAAASAIWIPGAVERYFAANLIPLPSWPYGIALALFTFFFVKTLLLLVRGLIRNLSVSKQTPGSGGIA
ncbi:MAG: hypothetical protein KBD07_00070 [Candidatus Omnitrophica bacterium]|jgi:membrane protein implicated in regulation of membrane protease activity|nr:hypothetical protein [Candidatus Omnitrophota bacterium]